MAVITVPVKFNLDVTPMTRVRHVEDFRLRETLSWEPPEYIEVVLKSAYSCTRVDPLAWRECPEPIVKELFSSWWNMVQGDVLADIRKTLDEMEARRSILRRNE